ncbi:sporulation membrane protein YtaF [Paenibacillus sambharensis]|uniref:Sporulation membrane protein YtaF n=1 Tax=Paenibacillus sambharensis TaxID=1803190 RepID=A0A2W1LWY5_9BACL|nr:MntP/YtaF family protein [Paenibacillus sambharensis]PZD96017.1 sporulation membrane protein YtaF [Paenibacillus sambharensis]
MLHLLSLLLLALAVSLDGFGVGITYGLRQIRIPVFSVAIIVICSGLVIWVSMLAGGWLTALLSPAFANYMGAGILIAIGGWALFQFWRQHLMGASDEQDSEVPAALGGMPLHPAERADALAVELPAAAASMKAESDREAMHKTGAGEQVSAVTLIKIEIKRWGLVIQILRAPQAADMDRSGTISSYEAVLLGAALSLDAFGAGLGAAMLGFSPLLTSILIAFASGLFLLLGLHVGFRLAHWDRIRTLAVMPGLILIVLGITRLL